MASKSYQVGRRFEYRVKKYLEKLEYLVVRSPQSRGPFDLIAIGRGVVLLIQCKVDGRLGVKGWNELYDVAERAWALPIVVTRVGRKLQWRQMLGRKNGLQRAQPWCEIIVHGDAPRSSAATQTRTISARKDTGPVEVSVSRMLTHSQA